jgi:mannose-1-phosphate guanylyltransferase
MIDAAHVYAVIMAGGSGTRFWPRSRQNCPKQYLSILGKDSLILSTVKRFNPLVPLERTFVITRRDQEKQIVRHLPSAVHENVLYEPIGRNTAACIGLAALHVMNRDPEGVMIVSPSDHLIRKIKRFHRAIESAVSIAVEKKGLVTLGIVPDTPATGYGYIQIGAAVEGGEQDAFAIKTFAEKPNLATAQRFIESGDFFWNSGLFVFKASTYFKAVKEFLPELFHGLMDIRKSLNLPEYDRILQETYSRFKDVSIDYGIMEHARNVFMVRGDFEWSDLGSWEQVYRLSPKDEQGNTVFGEAVMLDTKNSLIDNADGMIAVIGIENVIVVKEKNTVLICHRDRVEDVKQIVDRLKRHNLTEYI